MGRPRKKGPINSLFLNLQEDLAIDLAAFCEAHYGAPATRVIQEAVREFIDSKLQAEAMLRKRFQDARSLISKSPAETIRLVDSSPKPR